MYRVLKKLNDNVYDWLKESDNVTDIKQYFEKSNTRRKIKRKEISIYVYINSNNNNSIFFNNVFNRKNVL